MPESLLVGMAEAKVTKVTGGVLVALGLGSCIGVCLYDPYAKIAGMAHVVLPNSTGHDKSIGKFADTAVPMLLDMMKKEGASHMHIRAALAGGAQLFAFNGSGPRLEIGPRNASAVQEQLKAHRITIGAMDVGGNTGRTVHLFVNGQVLVKTIGQGERELTRLGS